MRLPKTLLLILLMVGLTGCYTQLEYSQQMNRVVDEKPSNSYSSTQDADSEEYQAEEYAYGEDEYYYDVAGEEEYIPVSYKNYNVYNYWNDCLCSPYASYNYSNYWYGPAVSFSFSYGASTYWNTHHYWKTHYYWHPYSSYHRYQRYMTFKYGPHWRGFGGHPYYRFGHPYYSYSSFYPYSHYSVVYNTYYFNQVNTKGTQVAGARYGPRSIGTDRVASGDRDGLRTRSSSGRVSSEAASRTRNNGVVRTRTVTDTNRTKATQTRTRGTSRVSTSGNSSTRSRSGNDSRTRVKSNNNDRINDRSSSSRIIELNREDRAATISRIGLQQRNPSNEIRNRNSKVDLQRQRVIAPKNNEKRGSFFGNIGRILKNSSTYSKSSSRYSIPNRTKSSRSTIRTRSSSSSSKSKVSRSSSSSSSKSRSRGSSSRSRSGGNDDGDSRSRGNN